MRLLAVVQHSVANSLFTAQFEWNWPAAGRRRRRAGGLADGPRCHGGPHDPNRSGVISSERATGGDRHDHRDRARRRTSRRGVGRVDGRAGGHDDPHARDGRRAGGQLGPPRHADGDGARSPTRCGRTSCASTPTTRSGPNRDRFVLSIGHASTLLYALLHLAGREGGQPGLRAPRRAVGPARGPQALPPARLALPGPPGVPLDLGRRDDDRAARPGRGDLGRDGDRRPSGRRRTSTARASSSSTTTSTRCAATAT